jgi:hypothetical protein
MTLVNIFNLFKKSISGVVLQFYEEEHIPIFLKAVTEAGLVDRFNFLIKGVGDLCHYLSECHSAKFSNDFSLSHVTEIIFGDPTSVWQWSDMKAMAMYRIIEQLVGGQQPPGFSNYFVKVMKPLNSPDVKRMLRRRTMTERAALCLPLKMFLAEQLACQQIEIVTEGMYCLDVPKQVGNLITHLNFAS